MVSPVGPSFTFVVGGARSGKSSFALNLASSFAPPRLYIATAEALDDEMSERIKRHREERGEGWETLEEPNGLAASVGGSGGYNVLLIDCLTLWLTNRVMAGLDDAAILKEADGLTSAILSSGAKVIAVSNEVGLGVVPENPLARRFRDLSGTMNQRMAEAASDVYFVASGLTLKMK